MTMGRCGARGAGRERGAGHCTTPAHYCTSCDTRQTCATRAASTTATTLRNEYETKKKQGNSRHSSMLDNSLAVATA
ncbi:hypothetical protein RR46_13351 [Papilio xuthus]|uniref:Uncharacterized protein n=1 Tax=Papilio xuthus TaxID=66420 RepID=A0A194PLZ6_PAPXU|nr:hypothetical protein RR46_13351 [Papilio xuthus]